MKQDETGLRVGQVKNKRNKLVERGFSTFAYEVTASFTYILVFFLLKIYS